MTKKTVIAFIIYSIALLAVGYFIKKKPATITQTKTITKVVTKVVTKKVYIKTHDNIVTDKTIDITKKDGTTEHIVENQINKSTVSSTQSTSSKLQSDTIEHDKTVTTFNSSWLFGSYYNMNYGVPTTFNPSRANLMAGYNIFGPIFVTASISGDLKTQSIGLLIQP